MAAARKLKLVLYPLIICCHYLTASAFDIQHVTGLRHFLYFFVQFYITSLVISFTLSKGLVQAKRKLYCNLWCCCVCILLNLYNGMIGILSKKLCSRLHFSLLYGNVSAWWFKAKDFMASSYLCCWVCISLSRTHIHTQIYIHTYTNTQAFSGLFTTAARGLSYLFLPYTTESYFICF